MSRLDTYRAALQVANPLVKREQLCRVLDAWGAGLVSAIIDLGLGPLWHDRVGRQEFHDSRMEAEARFLVQQRALGEVDRVLVESGIEYALIKGAANRLLLLPNPALRACHDLDVLVHPEDRMQAAAVLARAGFTPMPAAHSISREIVLRGGHVDIDLHWGLLREGRLRREVTIELLARRQRLGSTWVLSDDDAMFVLLVHPAFAKHLDSWEMGLHRVVDILGWLRNRPCDWEEVTARLGETGVRTAAWATLRWVGLLAGDQAPECLGAMTCNLQPGAIRRAWLNRWLESDLSARAADMRWLRLLAFSSLLHDTPHDALRAYAGRRRAARRTLADLRAFSGLSGQ